MMQRQQEHLAKLEALEKEMELLTQQAKLTKLRQEMEVADTGISQQQPPRALSLQVEESIHVTRFWLL